MSRPGSAWPRMALRVRSLLDRFALGLLLGLSVLLLLVGKIDLRAANLLGDRLRDVAVPVLTLISSPLAGVRDGLDRVAELLAVHHENARLREENRRLGALHAEVARLTVENRSLRHLLGVAGEEPAKGRRSARVVGDSGGGFVRALLLGAGSEHGIAVGMAATTPEGLVGRVVDVGRRSARVLLITDFNSRIPVVVAGSGDEAILEGDNSSQPVLRFLPLDPGFAAGDEVLTSGRGGMLPPGLMVGRITAAVDGNVRVRPLVDWTRLDYVALLDLAADAEPGSGHGLGLAAAAPAP